MSTHRNIERELEKRPDAAPPMHGQETKRGEAIPQWQPPAPSSQQRSNRYRVTVVLVAVAIVLFAAMSVGVALVQSGQRHVPAQKPAPILTATAQPAPSSTTTSTGQWLQVLTGYHVTEILAAPGHSTVLYACAIAPQVPVEYQSVQTVLRSADSGLTWQDIGKRAQMSRGCEIAINPTESNNVYVATSSNPPASQAVPSYILEHTSNGGGSWETIHPTVNVPGLNAPLPWQGTQLSFAGNRLYSREALPLSSTSTPQGPQRWRPAALARLLTSTDGGHSWQILDTQLAASGQSAHAYAINPTSPALFYELAYVPTEPGTAFPSFELSRSVDGGQTWQPVLQDLPWLAPLSPATILIGSTNPDVMYLSNTRCPPAQTFRVDGQVPVQPLAGSSLSMCMSRDAGKSWKTLQAPGLVMGGGVIDQQGYLYTQAITSDSAEIWRYAPLADTWGELTQAPRTGEILAGTPSGAKGLTALWLMSTSGQAALYRFIV